MNLYIALLRGINVGGKNIIKMADLKRTFEEIGLGQVKTYIQSGNVLFQSDEDAEILCERIEHKIEAVFGFKVAVVLRLAEEIESIIGSCPFSEKEIADAEALSEGESLYVYFLTQAPTQEAVEALDPYSSERDKYHVEGQNLYLLFSHSIRKSKLANNLQKLGVSGTMRNWKTVNKLNVLAKVYNSAGK